MPSTSRMNPLQSFAAQKRQVNVAPEAQVVFCRRRHQPTRPQLAKIRPGCNVQRPFYRALHSLVFAPVL
jgi:hypothetical protein